MIFAREAKPWWERTNYESCLSKIGKNTLAQYGNKTRTSAFGTIANSIQHQYLALPTTTMETNNCKQHSINCRSTFSSSQEPHLKTNNKKKKTKQNPTTNKKAKNKINIQTTRSSLGAPFFRVFITIVSHGISGRFFEKTTKSVQHNLQEEKRKVNVLVFSLDSK